MGIEVELIIKTEKSRQVIDITDQVQKMVKPEAGAVVVYVAHTTCGITTAEVEPELDHDLLDFLEGITPKDVKWRHPHDPTQSPSHSLSAIIGPNVTVPVQKGKLVLGTWQRIILVELDGPRERKIIISNLLDKSLT